MRINWLFLFLAVCGQMLASPVQITGSKMKVVYDQHKLSFFTNTSVVPFMTEIALDVKNETKTEVKKVTHPVFGAGSELVIHDENRTFKVSLFNQLPFVMIQKTIKNISATELKISKLSFFEGKALPGKDAAVLRTISTAGLRDASKSVGSYMFLALGNPVNNEGVVCAWLSANRGSGIVFSEAVNNQVVLKARIDYGDLRVPVGKSAESEILVIGYGSDVRTTLESYADAYAKNMNIKLLPPPTIYCTWYHGGASNEQKIAANTDFAFEHLKPYSLSVMQIDDFWQYGIRNNGPHRDFTKVNPAGPYPSGMKKTADYIKEKGMSAGIWYIPFAGSWYDEYWKDKMDLFLKEGASKDNHFLKIVIDNKPEFASGEAPFDARWGGTCLDLSNPKAQEYVGFIANRLSKEWGYKYFKMDGLWTGTGTRLQYVNAEYKDDDLGLQKRFNPAITPIEGFTNGLETVRRYAGKDVFLLGCSQTQNMRSFGPSMGRVDAMRVGPDNGANVRGLLDGPQFSSRLYFLNKRVWYNDPDPGYPRIQLPLEMAQLSLSWISLTGSLHGSSEQYAELPASRLDLLRKTMPSHDLKTVRPVDYLENDPPRIWHLNDRRGAVRMDIIGLFNFEIEKSLNVSCLLNRIDLPKAARYVGFDFWADKFIPPFTESVQGYLSPMACRIISIRPERNFPQVVSTSRHITQGVIDLSNEKWNGSTLVLSGTSEVIANDLYEIRLVVPAGDNGFTVVGVSAGDPAIKTSFNQEGSCIRVKLIASKTGKVNWDIRFKKGKIVNEEVVKANITGTVELDQIVVKWDKSTAYQYRLKKNGEILGEFSGQEFIDRDVKLGMTYTYGVQAKDWNGNWGDMSEAVVTMPVSFQRPAQPPVPEIYCTSLTPLNSSVIKNNLTFTDKPIILYGKVQENGTGAMPGKDVVYNIPEGVKRFVSTITLQCKEPADKLSKCLYYIYGDVLEMGEAPVMLGRSPALGAGEVWHFDVELGSRYKQIILKSHPIDTGSKVESINWINSGFLK